MTSREWVLYITLCTLLLALAVIGPATNNDWRWPW